MSVPHGDFDSHPQHPPPNSTSNGALVMGATNKNGAVNGAVAVAPYSIAPYPRQGVPAGGALPALHGLRRRWPLMVLSGLICGAVLAAAAWLYFQPKFRSYATLRVHSETPRLAFEITETEQAAQFEVYKRTQRELVLGDEVLLAALRNSKLANAPQIRMVTQNEDPVTWLRRLLRVDFPGDAEIMSISMEGDSASFIAEAVNAVLDAYVENVVDAGKQHRSDRLAELRKVLSVQEEKARRLRSKLANLIETLGSGDTEALSAKQQVAIERFAQLQTELGKVEFERHRAELKLSRLADQLKRPGLSGMNLETNSLLPFQLAPGGDEWPVPNALSVPSRATGTSPTQLETQVQQDPAVAAQQEVVLQAARALEEVSGVARRKDSPIVVRYRQQVQKEAAVLEGLKQSAREVLARSHAEQQAIAINDDQLAQKREFEQLASEVQTLRDHEKMLSDRLAEATSAADNIGTSSVNVELTRKELERLEGINDRIGVEIETLTIELSSASRVEALSRARQPQAPSQQDRIKKSVTFAVLGFLLPCVGLLWLDARRKLINGEAEIQQLATLRVLGTIPIVRRIKRQRQRSHGDALALREAIDRIRTVLLREADLSDYRVIQITSSIAGEAKTTVACQLATSIARAHRRTALVDFDLRRPSIHETFGIALDSGVCELLRGEFTVDEVLRPTEQKSLWLITAGRCDRFALEGLTKDLVDEVITNLRKQFEFVVIDSSPILPVVDALLIAQRADATILTALRDVSCAPQLQEAEERLRQVGANVVGSVVTTKADNWYGPSLDRYAVV